MPFLQKTLFLVGNEDGTLQVIPSKGSPEIARWERICSIHKFVDPDSDSVVVLVGNADGTVQKVTPPTKITNMTPAIDEIKHKGWNSGVMVLTSGIFNGRFICLAGLDNGSVQKYDWAEKTWGELKSPGWASIRGLSIINDDQSEDIIYSSNADGTLQLYKNNVWTQVADWANPAVCETITFSVRG